MQFVEARSQDLSCGLLAFVDDAADFLVDDLGGRLRYVLALRDRMTEEDLFLIRAVTQWPELFAEPEFGDHSARQGRCPADVVGRPGCDLFRPEDQLLGDAAAKEARYHCFKLELRLAVFVALWQEHRNSERPAARDNRYLVQRL